jgi:Coenzyme PQQ synthesis protein D (PqqD)
MPVKEESMMQNTTNPARRFRRNPEIVYSTIDGEVVMMSVAQGEYFGLNAMGSQIWNQLEEPRTIQDLCEALRERFEVSEEQCLEEVTHFLSQLAECGLTTVSE